MNAPAILVTGATGFIGKALIAAIDGLGREAIGLGSRDGDIARQELDPDFSTPPRFAPRTLRQLPIDTLSRMLQADVVLARLKERN